MATNVAMLGEIVIRCRCDVFADCVAFRPRLLRVISGNHFSVHDLVFVDSPEFHVIIDGGENGEVYNLAIRGADIGGSDGIDISGNNHCE